MILQLVLIILLIIALSYIYRRLRNPGKGGGSFKFWLYLTAAMLLLLAATGRVHWIGALFAGLVALLYRIVPLALQLLPLLHQWHRRSQRNSTLQSRYLRLELDHRSGRLRGEILQGPHAGAALDQLPPEAVEELLTFYRSNDPDSLRLMQAYLEQLGRGSYQQGSATAAGGSMSRREALEILGLDENANEADVQKAHKKLMQRLHPDRGGSNYLAAKVNEAKSVLTKKGS